MNDDWEDWMGEGHIECESCEKMFLDCDVDLVNGNWLCQECEKEGAEWEA